MPSLPDPIQDTDLRRLVDQVFQGRGAAPSFDPRLVRQLLDRAPDPELAGVEDFAPRALRADEVAMIWGQPSASRRTWLLRADEIARAHGRALFGPDGLVAEVLGPDAPGDLPDVPQ
jgi:hypothetical protein